MLWEYLKENWEALNKKCPASLGMLSTIVQICTGGFVYEEQLAEVRKWFSERSTKVCLYMQTLVLMIGSSTNSHFRVLIEH